MVVTDKWGNIKTIFATEVPGEPCAGIFLYYETSSKFSNRSGVVVKGDIEVHPI